MKEVIIVSMLFLMSIASSGQEVRIIKIQDLEKILESTEHEILIVNFWATWCAPCIKELPFFEEIERRNDPRVKIYLISLDFADKLNRVEAFVTRKQLQPTALLLDEIDYNSWIDTIDPAWQGAIPATLIKNTKTGQRKFIAKELQEGELDLLIKDISKN